MNTGLNAGMFFLQLLHAEQVVVRPGPRNPVEITDRETVRQRLPIASGRVDADRIADAVDAELIGVGRRLTS